MKIKMIKFCTLLFSSQIVFFFGSSIVFRVDLAFRTNQVSNLDGFDAPLSIDIFHTFF